MSGVLVTGGAGYIGSHEVDTIVETAWRWRERHPHGYAVQVNV